MNYTEFKSTILEAGAILLKHFQTDHIESSQKDDGSPVSVADRDLNLFLGKKLRQLLPQAGWLSEEDKDDHQRLSKEWVWVIDPLDGTKEFVTKVPQFSLSVGLVHNGKPVAGAVMNPVTGECGICGLNSELEFLGFQSRKGQTHLSEARTSVSRTEHKKGQIAAFEEKVPNITPIGSVAYKLLRVAAGEDDLFFTVAPKSEWDICGGIALLNASKKVYKPFDGRDVVFNSKDTLMTVGAVAGPQELVTEFFNEFEGII